MRPILVLTLVCVLLAGATSPRAQSTGDRPPDPEPVLGAVSITRVTRITKPGTVKVVDGALTLTSVSARLLIVFSHLKSPANIIGLPSWAGTDLYAVSVRSADGDTNPSPERRLAMLRALLRDEFKLEAHVEQREGPAHDLVVVRRDRRLGRRLKPSAVVCRTEQMPASEAPLCQLRRSGNRFRGDTTIAAFASVLGGLLGKPVIDRTGLTGIYRIDFESETRPFTGAVTEGMFAPVDTALQEDLGLQLEPTRAPIDVLVVDHIERPVER